MDAITAARIRLSRAALAALAAVALLAIPGLPFSPHVPDALAATLSVRLEAGPQRSVTFDAAWRVTSSRTTILAAPATVAATARRALPAGGTWLRISSGSLTGRWVAESAVAYVRGFAGTTVYAPARRVLLATGTYERYTFDAGGTMTAARRWVVSSVTSVLVDRTSIVRGQRHVRISSGSHVGWWIPGSATTPKRVGCTTGRPPAATTGRAVRAVGTATGEIALTFDMGGRLTPALAIIRYLELQRVCATIFPTGVASETTTGRAVMAEIAAHPELFEMGNHTVHHCNLRDGGGGSACPAGRPSTTFVTSELDGADTILSGLTGRHTAPYWRPPYGAVDATLVTVAAGAGYPYTVLWSTDTIDWRLVADGGPTAAQSAAKVIANRKAGAIVLMHLGGYTTRDALPAMIAGLRSHAYVPTSISALYRTGH